MAVQAIKATLGQALPNGNFNSSAGNVNDPVAALATVVDTDIVAYDAAAVDYGTDKTTFETALGVLVADGASPTEAHVTAVDAAYDDLAADYVALAAAYATLKADVALVSLSGDAVLLIDTAVVTTVNGLKAIIRSLLQIVAGSGTLAP